MSFQTTLVFNFINNKKIGPPQNTWQIPFVNDYLWDINLPHIYDQNRKKNPFMTWKWSQMVHKFGSNYVK